MAVSYRIGTVSKLTGISIDTLRAWERRYKAVVPKRGDQRRTYEQADVDRLILLRRAVEKGHSISSVASLPDEQLKTLHAAERPGAARSQSLIEPLLYALADFDYAALNDQLGRIAAMLTPADLVQQVVLPVMREVGEQWHRGELTVAQEHMMSGLVQNLLGTLMRLYRPAPGAAKLILTTLEGEQHCLGILAAAMLAAGAGLSPIYLGPGLPAKEIVHVARRSGAKAVILQLTGSTPSAAEQLEKIRGGLPGGVELWVGGNGATTVEGALLLADFAALDEQYRRLGAAA